jgi:hypothetical protein
LAYPLNALPPGRTRDSDIFVRFSP